MANFFCGSKLIIINPYRPIHHVPTHWLFYSSFRALANSLPPNRIISLSLFLYSCLLHPTARSEIISCQICFPLFHISSDLLFSHPSRIFSNFLLSFRWICLLLLLATNSHFFPCRNYHCISIQPIFHKINVICSNVKLLWVVPR